MNSQDFLTQFLTDFSVKRVESETLYEQYVSMGGQLTFDEFSTIAPELNHHMKERGSISTHSCLFMDVAKHLNGSVNWNKKIQDSFIQKYKDYAHMGEGVWFMGKRVAVMNRNNVTTFTGFNPSKDATDVNALISSTDSVRQVKEQTQRVNSTVIEPTVQVKSKVYRSSLHEYIKTNIEISFEYSSVKMRDININPEMLIPIQSGKGIDKLFSRKGGLMPGTFTMVTGVSGSGKTTVLHDLISTVLTNGSVKESEVMCFNAEMTSLDMNEEFEKNPLIGILPITFPLDFENVPIAYMLETEILKGYRIFMLDSLAECVKLISSQENVTGGKVTSWVLNLFKKAQSKGTALLVIQQVSKNGEYKGDTSILHAATSHMVVERKDGKRSVSFKKNRRNGGIEDFPMTFSMKKDGTLEYDIFEFERAIKFRDFEKKTADNISKSLDEMNNLFFEKFSPEYTKSQSLDSFLDGEMDEDEPEEMVESIQS
jgi:KaiC/GvpD/RAD55 family RecA-like ATPase